MRDEAGTLARGSSVDGMKRTFTIDSGGKFTITTRSPRRFLVVDLPSRSVFMRTDRAATAEQKRRANPARRVVLDTLTGAY